MIHVLLLFEAEPNCVKTISVYGNSDYPQCVSVLKC